MVVGNHVCRAENYSELPHRRWRKKRDEEHEKKDDKYIKERE